MKSAKWVVGALLLVAGLLALNLMLPRGSDVMMREALAQNRATAGGDYVVASARTTNNSQVLFVADTRLKRVAIFGTKPGRANVELLDQMDLDRAFPKGCSGQILLQPFAFSDRGEAVAIVDTVNKKMIAVISVNYGRLTPVGTVDLAVDLGG